MHKVLLLTLVSLLSACAIPSLRVTNNVQVREEQWQVNRNGAPTLVVAVPEQGDWRWLWTDALGLPIARQTLRNGEWQSDGLLAPNRDAIPLFTALMWLGSTNPQADFPEAQASDTTPLIVQQDGKTAFTYDCAPSSLTHCLSTPRTLTLSHDVHYIIHVLTP